MSAGAQGADDLELADGEDAHAPAAPREPYPLTTRVRDRANTPEAAQPPAGPRPGSPDAGLRPGDLRPPRPRRAGPVQPRLVGRTAHGVDHGRRSAQGAALPLHRRAAAPAPAGRGEPA